VFWALSGAATAQHLSELHTPNLMQLASSLRPQSSFLGTAKSTSEASPCSTLGHV
jgi:hypothetical protein